MPRDSKLYLEDIIEFIDNINEFVTGFTFVSFSNDRKTIDAVIRNLGIIGEASRNIPHEIKDNHSEIN